MKHLIKNKKWSLFTMLFVAIISVVMTSCDKEDDKDNTGEESASAYFMLLETETPQGRVRYIDAYAELPSKISNVSGAVEIGLNSDAISYGEDVFTISPDAKTITKWSANKKSLDFKAEGLFSYATAGMDNTRSIVFASGTQAYMADLPAGVVLEWNPSTMEIIKIHNVDQVLGGLPAGVTVSQGNGGSTGIMVNGKPAWPVTFSVDECCVNKIPAQGATIAIFDPATKSITYKSDSRLFNTYTYAVTDEKGNVYLQPDGWSNQIYFQYYNIDPSKVGKPFKLLRLDANGNIDKNFELDYSEVISVGHGAQVAFIYNNKVVLSYYDSNDFTWSNSFDNAYDWWGTASPKFVSIDLTTKAVSSFTGFNGYNGSPQFMNKMDGANFYRTLIRKDGKTEYVLLKHNSGDNLTEVTKSDIIMEYVGKLW